MITLGIPAYKESKIISAAIERILSYGLKNKFEILIATPDPETAEKVKQIKNKKVNLIFEKKREGQFMAYKKIVKKAKGDIIIFTDADAEIEKGAIEKLLAPFKNPDVGATGARVMLSSGKTKKGRKADEKAGKEQKSRWEGRTWTRHDAIHSE